MVRAACLGECMVELRAAGPGLYSRGFAGDTYNSAVYLRRELGADAEVTFVTALGDDPLSAEMRAGFRAERLCDNLAFTVEGGSPGLYMIELDAAGDRSFRYWRSASAARGWLRELVAHGGAERLAGFDLLYLSGVSLAILDPADRLEAIRLLESLRGRVGRIAFDPNVRPRLWPDMATARAAIEAVAACSDILLPSSQDGELLWAEAESWRQLARWRALGPPEVALTRAGEGALVSTSAGDAHVPAPETRVVDTSGGGDSFNGAYLAARLRGADPTAASRAGVALASRVVARPGAVIDAADLAR